MTRNAQLMKFAKLAGEADENHLPMNGGRTERQMELTYSNPRMSATIDNWPSGRHRVTARFEIEQDSKHGERGTRITDGAAKKLTYARMARIVDGSDGRTYIAELTAYGFISIMRGDMKLQQETIFDRDPRFAQALELFA